MKEMLNILYFSAIQIGAPDAGNNHTLEICTGLAKRGHLVYLFIPKPTTAYKKPEKIKLVLIPAIGKANTLLRTFTFYLLLPIFSRKYFSDLHPHVLYTRFSYLEFLAVLPLRLAFRFCHVAEINGLRSLESPGMKNKRVVIELLERFSLSLCDSIIAVTHELCEWVSVSAHFPKEKIAVIGNGVNVEIFAPRPSQDACQILGLDPKVVYINFTGSLKPWHGIQTVLEALPFILKISKQEVNLLVVGDGPERRRLLALAEGAGIGDKIRWIGRVAKEKVPVYINASAIGLSPFSGKRNNQVGSSALKVFEYMSCGRPVIVTEIGATFDKIIREGGFGTLVPPDDPKALAQAVIELINDPNKAKKMGERGRQAVLASYSWEKITLQTEQFLRQQLNKD